MSVQAPSREAPLRKEVPEEMTWDLRPIYDTEDLWQSDFQKVEDSISRLDEYKGRLSESPSTLLSCLKLRDELAQIVDKLYVYAHLHADQDTGNSHYQSLQERARLLYVKLGTGLSFMEPEILSFEEGRLDSFLKDGELTVYKHELLELLRQRTHVRSQEVEEVLAQASQMYGGPSQVYSMLNNADMVLPVVKDEYGNKIQLTQGNFAAVFLHSRDRNTRRRAYKAMFESYKQYQNTIAANYASQVNLNIFQSRVRGYESVRQMKLDSINVPVAVYDTLLDTVADNSDKIQRYLELRSRSLGLKRLGWYDLYVPLVEGVDYQVSYSSAREQVLESVKVLGEDYVKTLGDGFDSRWVDVVESKGKRSGAYSSGCYGTNPYMLLNWQDTLDSMFTLTHEAGHSMHSWYARSTQPYHYSGYTIFVAEVASTCNEALLANWLLERTDDPQVRKYIINHQLESIRLTLIRQTLFAEFEKIAHERAENGETLTADLLTAIHRELNEKYYAPAVKFDELIGHEWSRIPHFYSSFYVYQYATGISAALSLAKQIISEGKPAVDRYKKFLSSGSSRYSIDLLKDAGVDLSTPEPIQQALDTFGEYLNQFEQLI